MAFNELTSLKTRFKQVTSSNTGTNLFRIMLFLVALLCFLLVLPRALLSDPVGADYEHYIHDAQRHYQLWLDITASFHWPTEPNWMENTASSTHSYDSRPEADIHLAAFDTLHRDTKNKHKTKLEKTNENRSKLTAKTTDNTNFNLSQCHTDLAVKSDTDSNFPNSTDKKRKFSQTLVVRSADSQAITEDEFDEGPFLKMIFQLLSRMPDQPYQVNLHLTSIISKLALLPHPNLHEFMLNPNLPTAKNTRTLYKTLQEIAKRLTLEIPRLKNYKKVIENTRQQLMSEDPSYDESGDHNQLVESLIVLEEFCKELAAIAFVKYQHQLHLHR